VVWTGDERVFFYNPTTRLSMWDRPEELVSRADVDKHIQEPPHKRGLDDGKKTGVDKRSHTVGDNGIQRSTYDNCVYMPIVCVVLIINYMNHVPV